MAFIEDGIMPVPGVGTPGLIRKGHTHLRPGRTAFTVPEVPSLVVQPVLSAADQEGCIIHPVAVEGMLLLADQQDRQP